jgi:hypothetical protein
MNWSQLRKQIRLLICDELRGRVDFHKAVYRKSWESTYDRAWITIDGEQAFELSHGAWSNVWREAKNNIAQQHPEADWQTARELVAVTIADSGIEHTAFLSQSLHRYLEASIAESLQSTNPVIRAFAMIDRRTGRRTLSRITLSPDEHSLVKAFHELRTGKSS